ncbi:methionine--tRNA ligase [Patescibacteria group bacterium]|nr:methionine--tRNA ligase [Patescibacteria group bacterium]MCL5091752.1 methionine--tRNA ligase [Patescibacteria group bacterium]
MAVVTKKRIYITNSIPYVNAAPHVGHALEFVESDVVARYYRQRGHQVLLLCGSDENALKNVQAAEAAGIQIQTFVDKNARQFQQLAEALDIRFDVFQKGSDQTRHFPSSQKLWSLCAAADDIYKKNYTGLYCVGCETFYSPDELNENGECPEHPGKKLDRVSETNYFFRLSRYQKQLTRLIKDEKIKIHPEKRKNELLSFLRQPLKDISISRSNERAKNWGVPVPNDPTQRIYVWFDALNIYQTGIGFGWDDSRYRRWWPAQLHVIGKGIIRFHAVYWPAFLLSAGLKLPRAILVHDYLTINGQKMSKTLGNIVDPFRLIAQYGSDAVRYYFLREISPFSDGDYSDTRMNNLYRAELANELGNLVMRITTLAEQDGITFISPPAGQIYDKAMRDWFAAFQFNLILETIWKHVRLLNKDIDAFAPWGKDPIARRAFLEKQLKNLNLIGRQLQPFLPKTADQIINTTQGKIHKTKPLFPKV